MRRHHVLAVFLALCAGNAEAAPHKPLKLHPQNSHYFEFRGQPTVLITSGEHYGALINLDFDFAPYFDELASHGFNLTRLFTGSYWERIGSFNITDNTLAPQPQSYLAPWARSKTPGFVGGGNKFDLTKWNPAYFRRLKALLSQASKRGIVVELVLFTTFYEKASWATSPMKIENNINGIGTGAFDEVLALKDPQLQAIEEALVRKLVTEVNAFDNVYFEICNEPYFAGVTFDWQRRIADLIVATEKPLRKKHLIAQNIANGTGLVSDPHPAVSLFNFHYASPPGAVEENWALGKPLGDDETGFRGTDDEFYRLEGWDFLLAGGALYSNLDYSFTAAQERGTFAPLPPEQPGGGGRSLRVQLGALATFMNSIPFVRMAPRKDLVVGGLPEALSARGLAEDGQAYALYIRRKPIPSSDYAVRWTGFLQPTQSDTYTLHVETDDGVRLWIGDKLVVDHWQRHPVAEDTAKVSLVAGTKTAIRMEYYQQGGPAIARLRWSRGEGSKSVIPSTHLASPDGKKRGLKGEYFLEREWRTLRMSRTDATIDFDWSGTSPFVKPGEPTNPEWKIPLELALPAGPYVAEWIDTKQGQVAKSEAFEHPGGKKTLSSPAFITDVALRVKKRSP